MAAASNPDAVAVCAAAAASPAPGRVEGGDTELGEVGAVRKGAFDGKSIARLFPLDLDRGSEDGLDAALGGLVGVRVGGRRPLSSAMPRTAAR